jgi:hypothetical protein
MRSRLFALVVLVAGLSALAVGAPAVAGPNGSACVSTTQLRAENEVPPSNSTAFGHTQIKVRNDGTIEWKTVIFNPDNETFFAGHIHRGPAGMNGPVVQFLFAGPDTTDSEITHSGSASNPALAAEICANPSAFYVNYHTRANPGGAIRGQLK